MLDRDQRRLMARKKTAKKKVVKKKVAKKTATRKAVKSKTASATKKKKVLKRPVAKSKKDKFQRFEFTEGKASKYWEIGQDSELYTVRYGRIGSNGQSKKKEMSSEAECRKEVSRLVQSKLRKGYVFVKSKQEPCVSGESSSAKVSKKITVPIRKQSLSRYQQSNIRKLLKSKDIDNLKVVTTLLESVEAKKTDYEKIFTPSFCVELIRPRRGQSFDDLFPYWESLLLAVNKFQSLRKVIVDNISKVICKESYVYLSIEKLSDTAAEIFIKHIGQIYLDKLDQISEHVAKALGARKGYSSLSLRGLTTLPESVAAHLAQCKGILTFGDWLKTGALTHVTDKAAHALGHGNMCTLELDCLSSLSDKAAEGLAKFRGGILSLRGVAKISDKAARAFAKYRGQLELGITTISDHAAKALANKKGQGSFFLNDLESLSDVAIQRLCSNKNIEIPTKFEEKIRISTAVPKAGKKFLRQFRKSSKSLIDFIAITPGSFTMGSPKSESGRENDERQVHVQITEPFSISETVITQKQWETVMGFEPWRHEPPGYAGTLSEKFCGCLFPAVWITWDLAQLFCTTLTDLEHKTGRLEPTQIYRLPTEAEWEFCCRAGTDTAYSFGRRSNNLSEYGWHHKNSYSKLRKVKLKKPNPWGLYDMHGGVFEWCSDWYDTVLTGGNDPTGPKNDPGHDINGMVMGGMPNRVMRGGNRCCKPFRCRSAHRSGWGDEGWRRDILVGFRVVLQ